MRFFLLSPHSLAAVTSLLFPASPVSGRTTVPRRVSQQLPAQSQHRPPASTDKSCLPGCSGANYTFWLDPLLGCKTTEKLPSLFYLQRNLCLKPYFPQLYQLLQEKMCNFLMLSVSIISADVYHSHIMIQNLVCAIQCELQICAC